MSRYKGYRVKDCAKVLKDNGFVLERTGKHFVFTREGKHISLPLVSVNEMMWKRLVKENNLVCNYRLH